MPKITVEQAEKKRKESWYMTFAVLIGFAIVNLIARSYFGVIPLWFLILTIFIVFLLIYLIMQRTAQIGVDVLRR